MKIIVTGGAGFIGSHVTNELAKKHEVLVIDNLTSGTKQHVNAKIEALNLLELDKLKKVITDFKPEIVVHMAAQVELRKSLSDPLYDANQNIIATINILEACKDMNIKKFIYTSTGGARYGEPENLPSKETDRVKPLAPYGISKYDAEHYVRVLSDLHGFDYLILCFGNVYGPGDNPAFGRVISIFAHKMLKGEAPLVFGDGGQTRDFIYVEDIAKLIAENIDTQTEHKIYNVGSGVQTSVNEVYTAIEEILQTGIKPLKKEAIQGEVRDIQLDISLVMKDLGFKPTPFEEGMKKTVAWFKENPFK